MHTLVFSDTHLTKKFNTRHFEALKKQILKADNVIINGDFWEGLGISFDDFINSEWKSLFPLLKEKNAVYIYGNHDDSHYSDNRVYLFCDKAVGEYVMKTSTQNYLFKHGHQFLFPIHTEECLRKHIGEARTFKRIVRLKTAALVQTIVFGLFGPRIFPGIINYFPNTKRKAIGYPDHLLICGHTHRPYYNKKLNFLDIGFFNYGWANYLTIDAKGAYQLHSEGY